MKLPLARSGWLALVAALATLAPLGTSFGANYTWTGSGTANNWFSGSLGNPLSSNWNPGSGQPLTGADNIFFTGATRATAYQGTLGNGGALSASVNDITLVSSPGPFTISGTGIDLTVNGNITNSTSGTLSITNNTSTLTLNNTSTIDTGAGGITISRLLTGSGSLTKTGAGVLSIGGAAGFTGPLTISSGSFVQTGGTFGGSITSSGDGSSIRSVSGTFSQTAGNSTFNGATLGGLNVSGGSAQFVGSTTVSGSTTFSNAVIDQTANPQFDGPVTIQSGTVGSATQFAADFNGVLTVNGGVNNLSNAAINSNMVVTGGSTAMGGSAISGTLTQSGGILDNVGGTSGAISTTGGTISFADSAAVSGLASFGGDTTILGGNSASITTGSIALLAGGNMNLSFDTTPSLLAQNISSSGPMTWGGNLALNLTTTGSADQGDSWNLFDFSSQSGDLSGITLTAPGGSPYNGLTFTSATASGNPYDNAFGPGIWLSTWVTGTDQYGYTSQRLMFNQADGVLTVVPEPSTFVFAGIGAAMLGWHTWTRGRRKARMKLVEEHMRKVGEERAIA